MNDPNFVPLVLGVLSVIVSISAFVLGDSEKNKSWRIGLGISFLFLAIILGTYGVVVLMLPGAQKQVADQLRISENVPAVADTATITHELTPVAQSTEEATQVAVQLTPTSDPPVSTSLPPTPLALAPTLTQTPMPTATAMPTPAPTNTLFPPTATPYDCMSVVTTSRRVEANQTGLSCWLKLYDGASTTVRFNTTAQMTYSKMDDGNTVYFYIAAPGDVIDNVKGATIRPLPHVERHYGSLDDVKQFEIQYHSPGFPNGWVACLRDANNGDTALNSVCQQ